MVAEERTYGESQEGWEAAIDEHAAIASRAGEMRHTHVKAALAASVSSQQASAADSLQQLQCKIIGEWACNPQACVDVMHPNGLTLTIDAAHHNVLLNGIKGRLYDKASPDASSLSAKIIWPFSLISPERLTVRSENDRVSAWLARDDGSLNFRCLPD